MPEDFKWPKTAIDNKCLIRTTNTIKVNISIFSLAELMWRHVTVMPFCLKPQVSFSLLVIYINAKTFVKAMLIYGSYNVEQIVKVL